MGLFHDREEVRRYVGGIFEEAFAEPDLKEGFARSGMLLRLRFREPEIDLDVDMVDGTVSDADLSRKAGVEMSMAADVGHRFWLGKVNIGVALAKGEMRAKGPIDKIIKLVPLARQVFPRYREMLEKAGRDDLLNA